MVIALLENEWSPEQIVGHLRLTHADNPLMDISHESIYRAIYTTRWKVIPRELHLGIRRLVQPPPPAQRRRRPATSRLRNPSPTHRTPPRPGDVPTHLGRVSVGDFEESAVGKKGAGEAGEGLEVFSFAVIAAYEAAVA
jgi:IS30 family transposase